MNEMTWRILCWSVLVALTILPILLPHRRWLRIVSVLFLLFVAHSLLGSGLRLAARNVSVPDQTTLKSQVVYTDAWNDGRMATQKKVDDYLVPLEAIYISLGILALSPLFRKRKSQPSPSAYPAERVR